MWSWTMRGEPPRDYTELSKDGEPVGELHFIIKHARPATVATELCEVLNRLDREAEDHEQASHEYHERRNDERDALDWPAA